MVSAGRRTSRFLVMAAGDTRKKIGLSRAAARTPRACRMCCRPTLQQEGAVVLRNVRDSVKRQQLAMDLLSERISEHMQPTMHASACSVVALALPNVVNNFPIVPISSESLKCLDIASFLSKRRDLRGGNAAC